MNMHQQDRLFFSFIEFGLAWNMNKPVTCGSSVAIRSFVDYSKRAKSPICECIIEPAVALAKKSPRSSLVSFRFVWLQRASKLKNDQIQNGPT